MAASDRREHTRGTGRVARTTLATALAVALGLVGVAFVAGAGGEAEGTALESRVLSVVAAPVRQTDGYNVRRSFVGRVEARRESDVGFELPGLVRDVAVDEGDVITAGSVIATLDTELLRARRAELMAMLRRAEADLALAASTRERTRQANDADAVSRQVWDEAREAYNARLAAVAMARSAVDSVDVSVAKSSLVAPYDAIVAARYVDEGQVLEAGTPVVHLLERTRPEARIGVAGPAVDNLREGEVQTLVIGDRAYRGTLRAILPVRDAGTRVIDAIFELHADFGAVRRGDLAELLLTERVDGPTIELPLSALTEGTRGLWAVYVAEGADPVLRRRQVELLHQEADRVFVRGTLADGERVVLDGLHRLVPGQRVVVTDDPAALFAEAGS